jgi:hypothetical protein
MSDETCDNCGGNVEYTLVDRFFTDDGELDGVDPATAFCLGVEFAMFRAELISNENEFPSNVQRANVERIMKMCWGHKRQATQQDTAIHEWVLITVAKA